MHPLVEHMQLMTSVVNHALVLVHIGRACAWNPPVLQGALASLEAAVEALERFEAQPRT
jgi:hypothetical protein